MGWERKVCLFIATWILHKMKKKKARGWGYGFELYAGIKINVPQELSHKVAAVTYSKKLWSGKRAYWFLAQVRATFRFFS